jgi:hypothetical protein
MLLRLLLKWEVTVARLGLRWGKVASLSLAASCVLGPAGCSDEDEPDTGQDAASDRPGDTRTDTSVGTDARPDLSSDGAADRAPDTSADTGTTDTRADTGAPDAGADALPEGGNCIGGGDAARDGVLGMAAVQALRCANCHQDEPVDAGLILSGRLVSTVADGGVFPKNLTPDPATGLGCWTDQEIINAVMNGIDDEGQTLCIRMPRFGTRIDGGVAQEIVDFLRTLPPVNKAIPDTVVCPPLPEGGSGDAGTDAGTDGPAPDSPGPDGTAPDGGTDGTTPPDAAPDGTTPDGGADAAPDGGVDVVLDTGTDGVTIDVDIDGGG